MLVPLMLAIGVLQADPGAAPEPDITAMAEGLAALETINRPAIVALPRLERMVEEGRLEEARAGFLSWCGPTVQLACLRYEALRLDAEAPEDPVEAREFYRQACEARIGPACTRLGELLQSAQGGERELLSARAAFRSGCEGQDVTGCVWFADMLIGGIGGPVDREGAGVLTAAACRLGDPMGCYFYGIMRERDGERDEALIHYMFACRGGYERACLTQYVRQARAAASEERFGDAYQHYAAACALNEGSRGLSCYRAAQFATYPENPSADPQISGQLMQRACDLGVRRACIALEDNL
ncbi:MAG: hypothetical protein AAFX09_08490 [Pseudomonadota bacterium]